MILESLANFVVNAVASLGYWGIAFFMAVESSFIPFPSEIIVPPAAYLAQQGEMNIFLVILAGVIGSLLGALINYFLALTLGRKVIYGLARSRFAKFFLINGEKLEKAEKYFLKYGNSSTLICRFVPGVRQLVSIPAGFSKMNFKSFVFYTSLGSAIWVMILAALGWFFGANQELLTRYYKEISLFFILVFFVFIVFIIFRKNNNK
ncbi:DedA family protein [Patescibacteria group bacterium]|nr:DedA family protein [Patescibacteria group bacterium]MBU2579783.1 DedA family protein [Patescibacteria group bacterium]